MIFLGFPIDLICVYFRSSISLVSDLNSELIYFPVGLVVHRRLPSPNTHKFSVLCRLVRVQWMRTRQ